MGVEAVEGAINESGDIIMHIITLDALQCPWKRRQMLLRRDMNYTHNIIIVLHGLLPFSNAMSNGVEPKGVSELQKKTRGCFFWKQLGAMN